MEELEVIQESSSEAMFVGLVFNNINILEEYIDLISPEYDFSDTNLRFLYNVLVNVYLNHDSLTETSINIEVSKMNEESRSLYQILGGYNVFVRVGQKAKSQNSPKKVYERIKLYNVLRHLDSKGFAVRKNLDKLKDKTVDEVLKGFELQLHKTTSFIKNVNDGVDIGTNMQQFFEDLLAKPDIGIPIYCPIISGAIRGLRLGTVMGVGAATNKGKSRFIVRLLVDLAIVNQVPTLIIINETKVSEFKLQVLCCVVNNVILKDKNREINESKIAMGELTDEEKEIVREAARYVEENSKLIVYETYIYDPQTLKMIIRKHQLRDNIQYFFIDIYKPFRTIGGQNMAEWQMFSEGINQIKQMAVELNIFVMFTFQLKTTNENNTNLDVDATANGTHIAHYVDTLVMMRDIHYSEKEKIEYRVVDKDNPFCGQMVKLDKNKLYYDFKIVKNRAGSNGINILFEVQKGELIFNELGLMTYIKKQ